MNTLNYVATKMPSNGVEVQVEICEEAVASVSNALAVGLVLSNRTVTQFMSAEEIEESFAYALRIVLYQNSGARPCFETIPTFLSDIMMSLNMTTRGVRILCKSLDEPKRPHSYGTFLNVLTSLGIPVGKGLKVDPYKTTNVLEIFVVNVNGAPSLAAADDKVTVEELIVRALLEVSEEETDKLRRVVGNIEYLYVSRDELLRQWACTLPVGKR